MTFEHWNILLQACTIALLLGIGLWLKRLFGQQLKLRDTTIAALRAQIEGYQAEISRLQGETVPAIAEHYETLKKYAEDAAVEKNRLTEEIGAVTVRLQSKEQEAPSWRLLGEAGGLLVAAALATKVLKDFRDFIHDGKPSPEPLAQRMSLILIGGLMEIRTGIETEIRNRRKKLTTLFSEPSAKVIVN
jgi:hypothetical protein